MSTTLTIKNGLRRFDKARKRQMQSLTGSLLSALNNRTSCETELLKPEETKRIAIVRNNSRVGNTVFLIPFIRQVQQFYPDAEITLIQKMPWQQQIFENMGIAKFGFTQFTFKNWRQCLSNLKALRQTQYDLCLMPFASSQDAITCALINAKNKVAPSHEHYNNAFTHTFEPQVVYSHASLRCLSLLPRLAHQSLHKTSHQMTFSEQELEVGKAARQALGSNHKRVMAYFRGARGDKKMSDQAWTSILEKFDAASDTPINWVEVMGPEICQPLGKCDHAYRASSLRELACFLKHTDGFISCDTGPLHLADAADVACIGLYTHTNPEMYGLLGERCVHIDDIDGFDASKVLAHVLNQRPNNVVSITPSFHEQRLREVELGQLQAL